MSTIFAIDESGSTGHGGRYFIMASIIANNPRTMKKLYHSLPTIKSESKFYSAYKNDRINVLENIARANVNIVYVAIDKYSSKYHNIRGNDLYRVSLYNLLSHCATIPSRRDVNIYLDSISSIKANELLEMSKEIFNRYSKNVKRSIKVDSAQNKCIQLVDFVAGAIRCAYEYEDMTYYNIIEKKVSVARGF